MSSGENPLIPCEPPLVAAIVRAGVRHAEGLGLRPCRDFGRVRPMIADIDPDACRDEIPVGGEDGRPMFVVGPHDRAPEILAHLRRRLGPDGFGFLAPVELGGDPDMFGDFDEDLLEAEDLGLDSPDACAVPRL